MSKLSDPPANDALPAPEAAHVISRVIVEAWLRSVDRKDGRRFLENLGGVIETHELMTDVVPLRRGRKTSEDVKAERQALAALRQMLGVWLLSLPSK